MPLIDEIIKIKTDLAFVSRKTADYQDELKKHLIQKQEEIISRLENCFVNNSREPGSEDITALLLAEAEDNTMPQLAALPVSPDLCRYFCETEKQAKISQWFYTALRKLFKQIINRALAGNDSLHCQQRALDSVLKSLEVTRTDPNLPDGEKSGMALLLARAYYTRAHKIQPRGFSYPSKKKEALAKGISHLEQADETPEKRKFNAQLHLALAEMEEITAEELFPALERIDGEIDLETHCRAGEIQLTLALAEMFWHKRQQLKNEDEKAELQDTIDTLVEPLLLDPETTRSAFAIDRAWGAFYCQWPNETVEYLGKSIDDLQGKSFFGPLWDRVRRLLVRIYRDRERFSGWRKPALRAWEVCHQAEQAVPTATAIRWYWARQGDIYELAFRASEKNVEQRARIIDSLKGRPALHLRAGGEEMVRADATIRAGAFSPGGIPALASEESHETPWQETPLPWIAVHLYIDQAIDGPATGHALIHTWRRNSAGENIRCWKHKEFPVAGLWQRFWTWQENYRLGKKKASPYLEKLCMQIGTDLDFLFNQSLFPPGTPVVFIPHDFLHRLPLHGAIQEENNSITVWGQERVYSYLPAWWMVPAAEPAPPDAVAAVLDNWKVDGVEDDYFQSFGKEVGNSQDGNMYKKPATGRDLAELQIANPGMLFLFCHGHAHPENPYQAWLELAEGGITNREIRAANRLHLSGSRVMLGACETDLAPPLSTTVDEHIPLATAFLDKGAVEVVSTMWEVNPEKVKNLAQELCSGDKDPWIKLLHGWQTEGMKNYVNFSDTGTLYDYIAFRPYGLTKTV